MLPEKCMLAVNSGTVIVVDEYGDVPTSNGHCGVFSGDHRIFRRVDLNVRESEREIVWERLGRESDETSVTTALTSSNTGAARGDSRVWNLTKQFDITPDGVTVNLTVHNNTNSVRACELRAEFIPDFDHIFEVESFFSARDARDRTVTVAQPNEGRVRISGEGVGETSRQVDVEIKSDRQRIGDGVDIDITDDSTVTVRSDRVVGPGASETLRLSISQLDGETTVPTIDELRRDVGPSYRNLVSAATTALNALMLPEGVPAAGAPRFVAPFGRDSLIVGYQLLAFDSDVAERTLRFLAAEQGTKLDPDTLEEPGKILHEYRTGDLVETGVSLRQPYYGTVDATPLFVSLYVDTVEETGSSTLESDLYDAATAAVEWVLEAIDDDGFLRYDAHDHPYGLIHLGWKDSSEALSHPDGTEPTGRIALAEVQGYVYRALRGFESIARSQGDSTLADSCRRVSDRLFDSFESEFWVADEGCYALALDGAEQIPSVASNQTHAVWGGLGTTARIESTIDRLCEPDMLTSSGLRTFAGGHPAFDPLSYHRGSVWPHDNSIAALGFAERGFDTAAKKISERGLQTLADAYIRARPSRLGFPELFTGLDGEISNGSLVHPDSCEPAAWGAGSVFGFLTAHPDNDWGTCDD